MCRSMPALLFLHSADFSSWSTPPFFLTEADSAPPFYAEKDNAFLYELGEDTFLYTLTPAVAITHPLRGSNSTSPLRLREQSPFRRIENTPFSSFYPLCEVQSRLPAQPVRVPLVVIVVIFLPPWSRPFIPLSLLFPQSNSEVMPPRAQNSSCYRHCASTNW